MIRDLSTKAELITYMATNLLGILMLPIAYFWPRVMRVFFVLIFSGAAALNCYMATNHPDAYMAYAHTAAGTYRDFIRGWFGEHLVLMVYAISAGQMMIAAGLLWKGVLSRLSLGGIILFMLCIAPLGIGAAFPFSISVSVAAYWVMRKDRPTFIWGKLSRTVDDNHADS